MNFFKKHWIGIIFFIATWATGWRIILYIYPDLLLMQLIMPTLVISCLLLISKIIRDNYEEWPWRLKLSEWKTIIQNIKNTV